MQLMMLAGALILWAPQALSQKETIHEGSLKATYVNAKDEVTEEVYLRTFTEVRDYDLARFGDLTKVTFYDAAGHMAEQGYVKNGKAQGTWTRYNGHGEKVQIAHYEDGKKTGRWMLWLDEGKLLRVVDYRENKVIRSQDWTMEKSEIVAKS